MLPQEIAKIEATKTSWMTFFPKFPTYGGIATSLPDLGYAALGESLRSSPRHPAQKQSLSDAGLDNSVITAIEQRGGLRSIGGFVASLVSKK